MKVEPQISPVGRREALGQPGRVAWEGEAVVAEVLE
jgi:hypothetical protein